MPGYTYADNPHPATVAPTGLLEGCNSQRTGDTRPRGRTTTRLMQTGWTDDGRRVMEPITTPWIAKPCGSPGWPGCAGCCNNMPPSNP
ncbi:MAG: hypothetical protein JSR28_03305 [Proteobacteria bacterium]|nr:hypothetical protein [Pseudomonadota bacterium]